MVGAAGVAAEVVDGEFGGVHYADEVGVYD